MTFSLCMIVKNEEKTLARCLDSVKDIFDEMIIVDTGSVDGTKKVAADFGAKLYDFEWCNDFSAARNFSFSKATGDYIGWLDADDVVSQENREEFLRLKASLTPDTDVVMMKYATAFDKDESPTFFYYRERLIKRMGGMKWHGFVHEVITPRGNVVHSDVTIFHKPQKDANRDPARNLRLYENYLAKGGKLDTRESYYYARELYDNGKYELAMRNFEAFLTNPHAWYADKIGARLLLYHMYLEHRPEKAYETLIGALAYDTVSPQVLCLIGDYRKNTGNIDQAIFWYNAALSAPKDYKKNGFVIADYERYYPLLQLCVCYDSLGDYQKAEEYNRLAGELRPDSEQVRFNKAYFEEIRNNK